MADVPSTLRFEHHVIPHQRIGDEVILDAVETDEEALVFGVGSLTPARFSAVQPEVRAIGAHQILSFAASEARPDVTLSHHQRDLFENLHAVLAFRIF